MIKLRSILAASLALAVAAPGMAQAERYRLTLSTWGSPQHPQVTHFVPKFVELVTQKSEGRLTVRTFEGGEMVKQQFVATAVPQGTVDISLTTLDNWSGRVPEVTALASPLWTWSLERAKTDLVRGKPVFEYFDEKLADANTMILALFDIGPPVISSNFGIRKPNDLQGRTVRVYSKGAGQTLQALGAAPTTMGVGEVYSALQRGTVEAALGGLGGAVGLKHYEVTDHMFAPMGAFGTLIHGYVMNRDNFEALPSDLQDVVLEAAREARKQMQQYVITSYDNLLDTVRDNGNEVVKLQRGSKRWKRWRTALADLTQEAKNSYPDDLVDLIVSEHKSAQASDK